MKKESKLLIGIIAAVAVIAVVIVSIVMTAAGGSREYNRHLELAQRYLDELQYEQAIVEYRAAIEIDPKREDAYLGLAEVYVAMDDIEKALDVLAEGYEQTESERIAARQEELEEELARESVQEPTQEEEDLSEETLDRKEQASGAEDGQTGEGEGNEPDEEASQMAPPVTFVSWAEAGLQDHVMDWQDRTLEVCMREITGITDRDIMLSDVWELTELNLKSFDYTTIIEQIIPAVSWRISDISALGGLTNLRYLDLSYNDISDISALSGLTNLTSLDLSVNRIDDWYSNSDIRLSDISALSGLANLEKLRLRSNQISDISELSGLTNLYELDLGVNQINDIIALSGLTNLTFLNLDSNQISDINVLSNLTNLYNLRLNSNQISDISALSGLKRLYYLDLKDNPIEDYSPVEFIERYGRTLYK